MGRVRILVFVSILILCGTSGNSVSATDKNKDPIPLGFNLRFDNFEKEGERASLFLAGFETGFLRFSYLQAVRNFDDKKKYTSRKDVDLAFGIFGLKCRDLDYLWNKWKPEKEEGKPDIIYLMEHLGFIVQVAYLKLFFLSDTKPGFNIHSSFDVGHALTVEILRWVIYDYLLKFIIFGKKLDPLEIDDVFIGEGEIGIEYRFTKVPLSLSLGYSIWVYRISEQTLQGQGSTLKIIYRF